MEAVRPALVVVHGNVFHDIGKLVEIVRWVDVRTPTASDAVVNLRSASSNRGNHLVAGSKIVAFGFLRICALIRKDDAGIPRLHNPGALRFVGNEPSKFSIAKNEFGIDLCGTHGIVGSNLIHAKIFVLLGEVGKARHHRARQAVQPLKRSDFSDHFARVYI